MQSERAGGHLENVGAHDVGGHEIGRALHALEAEAANARQRFNGERLGQAWHAFHQGVAAAEEDEQELVYELGLADDDLCEFGADVSGEPLRIFHDQPRCSVSWDFKPSRSWISSSSRTKSQRVTRFQSRIAAGGRGAAEQIRKPALTEAWAGGVQPDALLGFGSKHGVGHVRGQA